MAGAECGIPGGPPRIVPFTPEHHSDGKIHPLRQTATLRPDERAFDAALAGSWSKTARRLPSYKDELNSGHMLRNVSALLRISEDSARHATDERLSDILCKHLDDYGERLASCEYMLIDAGDEQEFVIGDTPVIPAALGFGEAEAMVPLTPSRALLIVKGWRPPPPGRAPIFRGQRSSVRAFNKIMVQNAEQEVFCRAPVSVEFVRRHVGTRQVRLAPNLDTAAGEHSSRGPMLDRH